MSNELGFSAAFLSAIENGKKDISRSTVNKICNTYKLNNPERISLFNAMFLSKRKITVDLSILSSEDREQILKILLKYEKGDN